MTAGLVAPEQADLLDEPDGGGPSRRWRGGLVVPLVLTGLVVGLLVYVQTAELDDIEARLLAPGFLLDATLRHLLLVGVSTVIVVLLADWGGG